MKIAKPVSKKDFYFSRYIDLSLEEDLISSLEASRLKTLELLEPLSQEQANFRYQEGKWSIKEVLSHCIDTERILAYRALCFSRREELMLPGFDQDMYADEDDVVARSISDLLEEYDLIRRSTIHLFKRMKTDNLDFVGIASNVDISPRELGWTIAGHDLHHLRVIEEKYLNGPSNRGGVSLDLTM